MTKFNGELDDDTGSFIIDCEFIGYTYAFLSDILMGYLKAITCTVNGKKIIDGINKNTNTLDFVSLDEITNAVTTLETTTLNYREKDKKLKALAVLSDLIGKLEVIKLTLYNSMEKLRVDNKGINIALATDKIIFITRKDIATKTIGANEFPLVGAGDFEDTMLSRIRDFNEYSKEVNSTFTVDDKDFKICSDGGESYYDKLITNDFIGTFDQYQNHPESWKHSNFKKKGSISLPTRNEIDGDQVGFYNEFKTILNSETYESKVSDRYKINAPRNVGGELDLNPDGALPLDVIDFRKAFKQINTLQDDIAEKAKSFKNEISIEFVKVLEEGLEAAEISFDPSIKYLFSVLCKHVDLFMEAIRMVGTAVDKKIKNSGRKFLSDLPDNKSLPEYRDIKNETPIRAFPQYIERDTKANGYIDKWIGSNSKFSRIEEVKFIDDLYKCLIKRARDDEDFKNRLAAINTSWYPINPLDTKAWNREASNPWELVTSTNKELIFKLLVERMVTFLGYGNNNLISNEIIDMAKIEAEQLSNAMKDSIVKASINNAVKDDTTNEKTAEVIINSVKDNFGLNLIKESTEYIYEYAGESAEDPDGKNYLPVFQNIAQLKNENNPVLAPDGWDRESMIYGSTVIGGPNPGDGEEYIKILTNSDYINTSSYEPLISEITKSTKGDFTEKFVKRKTSESFFGGEGSTFKMSDINYIYGGKFKTPEFTKYGSEKEFIPLHFEFYSENGLFTNNFRGTDFNGNGRWDTFITVDKEYVFNTKDNHIYPVNATLEKESIDKVNNSSSKKLKGAGRVTSSGKAKKHLKESLIEYNKSESKSFDTKYEPSFYSDGQQYSLFGSEFYYSQTTDEAKALLLLHSLPFVGLEGKNEEKDLLNDKIIRLFDNRAGFVKVPYSWVLFLGGLFYRMKEPTDIIKFVDGGKSLIPNLNASTDLLIEKDDYLLSYDKNLFGTIKSNGTFNFEINPKNFNPISNKIKNLPKSVRDQFISEFENWVGGDFKELKTKFEIFPSNSTPADRSRAWNDLKAEYDANNLAPGLSNNYIIVSPTVKKGDSKKRNDGNTNNFYLESRGHKNPINSTDTTAAFDLMNFMVDHRIIANSTYRIWNEDADLDENLSKDIKMPTANVDLYLGTFIKTFKELNPDDKVNEPEVPLQAIFNSVNVDDIKLSIYKNIKSIYDKWIVGVDKDTPSVIISNLFERFRFIDRAYNDIGTKFNVSPMGLADHLLNSTNVSFYSFIARLLNDNHFDFIPLPTFIDYSKESAVKEIFEPTRFSEMEPTTGPQFICMYIGERSSRLDIYDRDGKNNRNDGVNVDKDLGDVNGCLTNDDNSAGKKIPFFLVSYADQNQSIFKNIKVDQKEFTETNEGLQIIENLSKQNRNSSLGQNLFDIYENRSYSAEIEMLGCAQIQPFMYFQLNNIPMFKGAYTIINTTHHITPNHMTSTFKGVRIRCAKTKFIDKETLYYNLIENLDGVDITGGDLDDLKEDENKNVGGDFDNIESLVLANTVDDALKSSFSAPLKLVLDLPKDSIIHVVSDFGPRTLNGAPDFHYGIDFRASVGTPVYSATDGKVFNVKDNGDVKGGLYIDIEVTTIGGNSPRDTHYVGYFHLSSVEPRFYEKDSEGNFNAMVSRGELIGHTGDSGGVKEHLHVAVRDHWDSRLKDHRKNPQQFFNTEDPKWTWEKGQYPQDTL
jgi:murein DD-endopeptidase MepM/ murein hydrolase activator NlpD